MIGYVIISVLPLFNIYPLCPKNRIFIARFSPVNINALPGVTLQNPSKYYFVYRRAVLVYTEFGGEILARSGITSVKSAEFDIAVFIGNSL